jgi:hypothetical protein
MKIQKAIVRQGTAIIDKKNTRTLKSFRMVLIKDGPDLPLFQHPLTLSKLALFLTDAYRVRKNDTLCTCLLNPHFLGTWTQKLTLRDILLGRRTRFLLGRG